MACDFCGKESDLFTVNGEEICEECMLKNDWKMCTKCGKLTKFVLDDLCSCCQKNEKDD